MWEKTWHTYSVSFLQHLMSANRSKRSPGGAWTLGRSRSGTRTVPGHLLRHAPLLGSLSIGPQARGPQDYEHVSSVDNPLTPITPYPDPQPPISTPWNSTPRYGTAMLCHAIVHTSSGGESPERQTTP